MRTRTADNRRWRHRLRHLPAFDPGPRKEDSPCCVARTDADGRLPVGFCSDDCIRRQHRDARLRRDAEAGH